MRARSKAGTRRAGPMHRSVLLSAACGLVTACGAEAPSQPDVSHDGMLVLTADRVLDGRGGVLEDHGVVVREGRIAAVLPEADLPEGDRRDFPGATILPGFIDTHVHLDWHFGEDGQVHPRRSSRGGRPSTRSKTGSACWRRGSPPYRASGAPSTAPSATRWRAGWSPVPGSSPRWDR